MSNQQFEDRLGTGINKRRLHILSNNGSYMDVKIEPIDEGVTRVGTPINAALFNRWSNDLRNMRLELDEAKKKLRCLESEPDVSDANLTGIPTITFADGKLKFSNLKGEPGDNFALTDIGGKYIFYIKDHELRIDYLGNEEPPFKIEDGNLIIDFEESN